MLQLHATDVQRLKRVVADGARRETRIFNALGDENRLKIFKLLIAQRELCVSDVARLLEISISAASQQLRILEMADLIRGTRMGQMMCYELNRSNPMADDVAALLAGQTRGKAGKGRAGANSYSR